MLYNWFNDIDFAWPWAFALLALLPALVYYYTRKSPRRESALTVSSTRSLGTMHSWKRSMRHVLMILRLLCLLCLIIVLARPQTRNDEEIVSGEGIDIILCMDVSGSMLAQDFSPNRLEAMKQMAADFVDKRPTDRIGLVLFAGESFTSSPLTGDRNTLKSQIFAAQTGYLADGTAIGDGLGTSVERLKGSPVKSKVIILLTDGENSGGRITPGVAKEIAKSYGIRVYTIGMATEGFAAAPTQSADGQVVMRNQKVNVNEELLREIAGETGGIYFRARDNAGLRRIYDEIDKLEKSTVEVTSLKRFTEKYLPFAIAAALFLLLELIARFTLFKKFP